MLGKSNIYFRWLKEIKRQGIFHPGQRVGVAVSGGPDSVLLLHFMKDLALEWGITLAVVHFNHHLRGAESDADESFVRSLADSIGIAFIGGEAEVARVAREKKRNLEATARELRYRFFFSLVEQGRLDKVVTAHTANDQAETVLLRLLRGAGTRGLCGIYPVLEGKVARPFLDLTRAEITREMEARQLECRLDSSNLDSRLRRNKIRLELLPCWKGNSTRPSSRFSRIMLTGHGMKKRSWSNRPVSAAAPGASEKAEKRRFRCAPFEGLHRQFSGWLCGKCFTPWARVCGAWLTRTLKDSFDSPPAPKVAGASLCLAG